MYTLFLSHEASSMGEGGAMAESVPGHPAATREESQRAGVELVGDCLPQRPRGASSAEEAGWFHNPIPAREPSSALFGGRLGQLG